jgi:hypothetical protein
MGSGFDDWIYWHFFTVTIIYYSSQLILTAEASLHSASRSTTACKAELSRSLLPAISRYGHSWHRAPVGPVARYLLDVETITVFFFSCGAPSLTIGRVWLLYMVLALASAVFLWSIATVVRVASRIVTPPPLILSPQFLL